MQVLGYKCVTLLEIAKPFSRVSVIILHSCQQCESPSCSTFSSTLDIVSSFYFSQLGRYAVVSHCAFNVHFLNANDVEHLFLRLFASLTFFLVSYPDY